jgi:uncharacterized cofD-like protein
MMAAMTEISGSFEVGLRELGRVLAITGEILPSTLDSIVLVAELRDKSYVIGESNMHEDHASVSGVPTGRAPIERVFIKPAQAAGYPEAVRAILDADMIVVGPGSLYTSILPNLLVKDILCAICASAAYKVFVCNVATEPGETDSYHVKDFLAAVERHVDRYIFDAAIINTHLSAARPAYWRSEVVTDGSAFRDGIEVIAADVVDDNNAVRHDPAKLARTLLRAWAEHSRRTNHFSLRKTSPPHLA